MQVVKIRLDYFNSGEVVFAAGSYHAPGEAALRQVEIGNGDLLDVPDDAVLAETAAKKAELKAEKADADAAAARAAADAAREIEEAAAAVAPAAAADPAA